MKDFSLNKQILNSHKYLNLTVLGVVAIFISSLANASSPWLKKPSSHDAWGNKGAGNTGSGDYHSKSERTKSPFAEKTGPKAPFTPGSNNIALHMGQVFLMGKLGSNYKDTLGLQARYTYGVSDIFAFNASFSYSDHSEGRFNLMAVNSGIRMNLNWFDKIIPYAMLGMGFYRPSYRLETTNAGASALLFGLNVGPGIDLQLSDRMFFGAGLTFNDMFSNTITIPTGYMDVGGSFISFMIHTGMTI